MGCSSYRAKGSFSLPLKPLPSGENYESYQTISKAAFLTGRNAAGHSFAHHPFDRLLSDAVCIQRRDALGLLDQCSGGKLSVHRCASLHPVRTDKLHRSFLSDYPSAVLHLGHRQPLCLTVSRHTHSALGLHCAGNCCRRGGQLPLLSQHSDGHCSAAADRCNLFAAQKAADRTLPSFQKPDASAYHLPVYHPHLCLSGAAS